MEKTDYFQPQDDSVLLSELELSCIKDYLVVCIVRNRNFPLVYIKAKAISEQEAIDKVHKENPTVKILRAYQVK